MNRLVFAVWTLTAAMACAGAYAQTDPRVPGPPEEARDPRLVPMREPRGRMGPPPGRPGLPVREASFGGRGRESGMHGPMWRMSPEERRQLREDIHMHGRELYRPRRPPQDK